MDEPHLTVSLARLGLKRGNLAKNRKGLVVLPLKSVNLAQPQKCQQLLPPLAQEPGKMLFRFVHPSLIQQQPPTTFQYSASQPHYLTVLSRARALMH
jgi:hypothetical protein